MKPKLLQMTNMFGIRKYYREDLEHFTPREREDWVLEQFAAYDDELRNNPGDDFVEEVLKRLQKETKRWISWNHRAFGPVKSRAQILHLSQWVKNLKRRGFIYTSGDTDDDVDVLDQFEDHVLRFDILLDTFKANIYNPLADFFYDDDEAALDLQDIIFELDSALDAWKGLMSWEDVDVSLFTLASKGCVDGLTCRQGQRDFGLVLRLLPDLSEKAHESLRLVRRWRLMQAVDKAEASTPRKYGKGDTPAKAYGKSSKKNAAARNDEDELRDEDEPSAVDDEQTRTSFSVEISKRRKFKGQYGNAKSDLAKYESRCQELEAEIQSQRNRVKDLEKQLRTAQRKFNKFENEVRGEKRNYRKLRERLQAMKKDNKQLESHLDNTTDKYHSVVAQMQQILRRSRQLRDYQNQAKDKVEGSQKELKEANEQIKALLNERKALKRKCAFLKTRAQNNDAKAVHMESQLDKTKEHGQYTEKELFKAREELKKLQDKLSINEKKTQNMEEKLFQARERADTILKELKEKEKRAEQLEQEHTQLLDIFRELPKRKEKPLSNYQLDVIAANIEDFWPDVAKTLGMSRTTTDHLRRDYSDEKNRSRAMLYEWKARSAEKATMKSLVAALIAMGYGHQDTKAVFQNQLTKKALKTKELKDRQAVKEESSGRGSSGSSGYESNAKAPTTCDFDGDREYESLPKIHDREYESAKKNDPDYDYDSRRHDRDYERDDRDYDRRDNEYDRDGREYDKDGHEYNGDREYDRDDRDYGRDDRDYDRDDRDYDRDGREYDRGEYDRDDPEYETAQERRDPEYDYDAMLKKDDYLPKMRGRERTAPEIEY
ncbi:uncharacterized protein LOC144884148 [Branchiostoma floridae x Branchiostoma japonicum]